MIKYIFLILLVFINHCSFNSNSKFWTKEKKVEQLSKNVKKIFEDEKVISKEFNENITVKIPKNISNNFTPFGLDISEESANKADLSFKKRGGRAICSPATKVLEEFGENKFSGAILRSYLEHEHEPFEVLKNLKFTLKNDACVIIKVPNYDSVNRKIRKEKWCGFHFPDHVNQFTPKTLLKMVKDTNYEVLKFNFLDYLPTSDNMWMVVRPI